jgi:acetylornithine deacetylase/succinyl-diaminopimelate desuccinylase-like protein
MRKARKLLAGRGRSRVMAVLLLAVSLCVGVLQFGGKTSPLPTATVTTASAAQPAPPPPPPPVGEIVDGSKNPEKIPDHVAYSLVFRVIAGRQGVSERRSIRAYVNQLGVGQKKCRTCPKPGDAPQPVEDDPELEAVVAAAEEYHQQVTLLDQQAKAIKDATWQKPTPEAIASLAELRRQKIALVSSVVAALEEKLGPDAAASLRLHVNERVKRRTKLRKDADAR